MKKTKKTKNLRGPVSSLIIFIIGIIILSFILNRLGFQGYQTKINNGVLEDSLVSVRNLLSVSGIQFVIGHAVSNFSTFAPLVTLIIALLGIGICEKSGFLNALFKPLKRVKFGIIVFVTIFVGIISSVIGEYSYVFLIPFAGVMYKYLGKNPILGILITYLAITLGYGTSLLFNYNDYSLGLLTEAAATVDVDPNYHYHLSSSIYIMVASTIALTFLLYFIIMKFLVPKLSKKFSAEAEDLADSKKGMTFSLLAGFGAILLVIYMILDIHLPFAGILLDQNSDTYIAKLFSDSAPFKEGLVIIISTIMMIFGFVYGKFSGNIKNSNEYSLGLSKNFENLGLVFVLMFFISQLTAILDWTNIGVVVSSNLITFVSKLQFSGVLLIIAVFVIILLMSFLIPDTLTKWQLLSPVAIPLFMRSNITPDFTQFIFQCADAVGKAITPLFIFFIIMLAFLEKYRTDERKQISISGVFKGIMPTVAFTILFWIIFISLWYLIGFPIGPSTFTTL